MTIVPSAAIGPVLLIARLLMCVEFILFGVTKIFNAANMQAYMESFGVPGKLIWLAVLVQIGCGTLVAIGFHTRVAALLLAGFCVVATTIFHTNFSDLGEVSDFTKDLATAGGFLVLVVFGAGPLSIDEWRR
jgi:putative oxidoreductase